MKTINTYYIKRDNTYIWLGQNIEPLDTDEIIEVRPLVIADEGKILVNYNGDKVGQCVWVKNNEIYTETDDLEDYDSVEDENNDIEIGGL